MPHRYSPQRQFSLKSPPPKKQGASPGPSPGSQNAGAGGKTPSGEGKERRGEEDFEATGEGVWRAERAGWRGCSTGIYFLGKRINSSGGVKWNSSSWRCGGVGKGRFFEDNRKDGNLRRAWVVTDYKGKRKNGVRSFRGLTEVDCKGKRLQILSYTSHSGPMATGELMGTGKPQPQWVKITSGTLGSNLFKYVCPK